MDFKNICEFWSLIKMHYLLVCNIIKTMPPYNGCSQMVSISLKTKKYFIAHPWCLLSVVGLEEYLAHDLRAATSVLGVSGACVQSDRHHIRIITSLPPNDIAFKLCILQYFQRIHRLQIIRLFIAFYVTFWGHVYISLCYRIWLWGDMKRPVSSTL